MANRDVPNGFTPVGMLTGGLIPVRQYPLYSSHQRVGVGDVIECLANGTVDIDDDPDTSDEKVIGVAVAIYDSNKQQVGGPHSSEDNKYLTAGAGGYVDVALAVPNAVFKVQVNGTKAETTRFSSADTDAVTQCNTVTGRSLMELAETAQTGEAQWLVIDKVEEPNNDWNTDYTKVLVIACAGYFVGAGGNGRVGI